MNLNLTLSDYNSIDYENCTSLLLLVSYIYFFSVYFSRLFIYIFLFISYTSLIYFLFFTVLFIVLF